MAKLISKVYGDALFELAIEENQLDALTEEIKVVKQILLDEVEFQKLMNHPQILKEEKIQVAEEVFKGRVSDALVGFIRIILEKDRYDSMDEILGYFLEEVKVYQGIGTAYVTSPMELSDKQKKNIEEKLLETTEFKSMEMHYAIDESLIGGVIIRIGDRVVDSSIKTKLQVLKKQMLEAQV